MTKINEINFKNYRAFWGDKNKLKIEGKNALIYGENGSGKSSLYEGLKDFFRASDVTWTIEQIPIHLKTTSPNEFEVEVKFNNPSKTLKFDGQPINDETVSQTFLLNSFLSYKEMLRTHFLEKNDVFEEKFFELITQTLLVKHEIGGIKIGDALEDLRNKLSNPTNKTELLKKAKEKDPEADEEDLEEVDPNAELDNFKSLFDEKLKELSNPLNKILSCFKQAISVKFDDLQLAFDDKEKQLKGELGLDVTYINIDHINHLEILNEARLSALAISIYLAAIVTNPVAQSDNYKILFLDDVFIGLDTSNRLPLLNILQDFEVDRAVIDENGDIVKNDKDEPQMEKIKFFGDFQIFITTYDRYWFEMARKRLGDSWNTFEMFVGEVRDSAKQIICEKPVIYQESLGNLEKARRYFYASDYFSSGNWLRKALEEELERLIPKTYRIDVSKLDNLIDRLIVYYTDCSCLDLIPSKLKMELKTFKDSVLNPSSHFNLESPIYKAEIKETFRLLYKLKNLPKIEKRLIIGMRSAIFYRNAAKDYNAEYILRENIYAVKVEDGTTRISDANNSTISYQLAGLDFSKKDGTAAYDDKEIEDLKSTVIKLSEKSVRIMKFLDLPEPPDWKEFTVVEGKTISELASEI